jgi:hypothetical protein
LGFRAQGIVFRISRSLYYVGDFTGYEVGRGRGNEVKDYNYEQELGTSKDNRFRV